MAKGRRARKGGDAFTLLEVLGAVAILGITGAVLATASIESLQRAGDARGGLEASLLADDVLGELRLQARTAGVQALRDQREQDGYTIRVEARPFDFAARDLAVFVERERGEPEASVLTGNPVPALYEVRVDVSWGDGATLRSVERTTFVFDGANHPDVSALKPPDDPDAGAR